MKNSNVILLVCVIYSMTTGCKLTANNLHLTEPSKTVAAILPPGDSVLIKVVDAGTIWERPQVPVLCYHQIREWRSSDSKTAKDYIVPVNNFREEMKLLSDSGYHTILPDELIAYLVRRTPLPSKPVMLSFDDTDLSQYTIAAAEMKKYGFKGVFFIMTVSLGRPGYMSSGQVKQLSDDGNIIGSHTWDHHNVKKYQKEDWVKQIEKPTIQLETITGKPIHYFAYPFGLWDSSVIPEIKNRGFAAAFQLSTKRDKTDPLFTIRRMIVPGYWNAATMHLWMQRMF
jgi:peptidoglycan/xylan/chitin deacetylase (PgdA/CDA1 family)